MIAKELENVLRSNPSRTTYESYKSPRGKLVKLNTARGSPSNAAASTKASSPPTMKERYMSQPRNVPRTLNTSSNLQVGRNFDYPATRVTTTQMRTPVKNIFSNNRNSLPPVKSSYQMTPTTRALPNVYDAMTLDDVRLHKLEVKAKKAAHKNS